MPSIKDMLPVPPWEGPPVPRILMRKIEEAAPSGNPEEVKTQIVGEELNFEAFAIDVRDAGVILDLMADHNRKTKEFLNAWIKYYFDDKILGRSQYKRVSLEAFKKSFANFNDTFYVSEK